MNVELCNRNDNVEGNRRYVLDTTVYAQLYPVSIGQRSFNTFEIGRHIF